MRRSIALCSCRNRCGLLDTIAAIDALATARVGTITAPSLPTGETRWERSARARRAFLAVVRATETTKWLCTRRAFRTVVVTARATIRLWAGRSLGAIIVATILAYAVRNFAGEACSKRTGSFRARASNSSNEKHYDQHRSLHGSTSPTFRASREGDTHDFRLPYLCYYRSFDASSGSRTGLLRSAIWLAWSCNCSAPLFPTSLPSGTRINSPGSIISLG